MGAEDLAGSHQPLDLVLLNFPDQVLNQSERVPQKQAQVTQVVQVVLSPFVKQKLANFEHVGFGQVKFVYSFGWFLNVKVKQGTR